MELWKAKPTADSDHHTILIQLVSFVFTGTKYITEIVNNAYKTLMKLTIRSVSANDYGAYKCISRNSLGDTDGTIKLYRKYNYTK